VSNQGISPAPTTWHAIGPDGSAPRPRTRSVGVTERDVGGADADVSPRPPSLAFNKPPLYTPEQRLRRDQTRWTLVQGILAPIQFVACLVSVALVLRFLLSGAGELAATISIVVKTALLYAIMVTGSIWEKVVFDKYLFAEPFFWEDAVSMVVIALHTAYLYALLSGSLTTRQQMVLALVAYATYVINAIQFLLKLRAARLRDSSDSGLGPTIGSPA
jgi:3-vinyl bacteriochlorophyllide hydratase